MLNTSDVYTNYGYSRLYGCWNSGVSKFDSSGFYNYEQDNLPLYDLEERTNLLWERLGNTYSSITGFSFIISSTTPTSCNTNYFSSLSSCLNALPEVINAPYLIEVGYFGHLGEINLSNKIFGPRGSIEIINRAYGRGDPASITTVYNAEYPRTDTSYYYASAVGPVDVGQLIVVDLILTPTLMSDIYGARILSNNQFVCSSFGTLDTRLVSNLSLFTRKVAGDDNNRLSVALAAKNTTASAWTTVAGSNHKVTFTVYEKNPETTDLINTYDASCINEISNTEINWGDNATTTDEPAAVLAYGNRLSGIKVYNCNGPIFIRNFTVDGGGYGGMKYGIDVRNSTVHLENCSVARCTMAGLNAMDSNVIVTRGFVSYRNYGFNASGTRVGVPWAQKVANTNSNRTNDTLGAGILLNNSILNFSATYARDASAYLHSMSSVYDTWFNIVTDDPPVPTFGDLVCLSKNDIGIHAINSKILGGRNELSGQSLDAYYDAQQIFVEHNTEAGIRLESSELDHSGRLLFNGNFRALHGINSKILSDVMSFRFNQKEGCLLENSTLKYNKDLYAISFRANQSLAQTYQQHQNFYYLNGTHIKLLGSTYEPVESFSSTASVYERFIASSNFGITQNLSNQRSILPSIIVDNNSKLTLLHPTISTEDSYLDTKKATLGAAISVTNGSEVTLKGSKDFMSKIYGPTTFDLQKRKAGIYVGNSSNLKVQGPTVIARYGIDILAENGSKIEFSPHKTSDGRLDISGFNLTDKGNHTIVELHSTRSCLVADNNSTIVMKDLGDYTQYWKNGTSGANALLSGTDFLTNDTAEIYTAPYTSGGSFQFYPNPNDSAHYPPAFANPTMSMYSNNNMTLNAQGYYYFFQSGIGDITKQNDFSGITHGGMCLRALNNSKVIVDNVHFPAGWWVPSGAVYDISGAESAIVCNRLFIWNIADLSQLDAKYVSVSGLHPADCNYIGPSGTWNNTSGMPTTTPDTSSVAILDYYGRATNHTMGKSVAVNKGPFRLYFSTDPACNWFTTSSYTMSGYVPQLFAQGYNFSSNLYAPPSLSSIYTSLIKQDSNGYVTSGFWTASAFMFAPFTTRVMLDESAANTFANAKHNSVGKSGLGKLVSIYFPYTTGYGSDSAQSSAKTYGRGMRSVNTFDLDKDN